MAASNEIVLECVRGDIARQPDMDAVVNAAHRLPNRYVIHCLGPVYGRDEPADELLASCYREALRLAEDHGVRSIAFASISTGAFGYPMEEAARISFGTIRREAGGLKSVRHIRFVLYSEADRDLHERVRKEVAKVVLS